MAGETAVTRFQAWQAARLQAQAAMTRALCHDVRGMLAPALLVAEGLQASDDPRLRLAGERVAAMVTRATERLRADHDYAVELPALTSAVASLEDLPLRVPPGLTLIRALPAALAVRANLAGFATAFDELAANSATAGARVVQVTGAATDGRLAILVRDDGSGLSASSAAALFAPPSGPGDPIGLALARDLLRGMGGDLMALADGGGAAFEIRLQQAG